MHTLSIRRRNVVNAIIAIGIFLLLRCSADGLGPLGYLITCALLGICVELFLKTYVMWMGSLISVATIGITCFVFHEWSIFGVTRSIAAFIAASYVTRVNLTEYDHRDIPIPSTQTAPLPRSGFLF